MSGGEKFIIAIGAVMMLAGLIINFLFGHRIGPRGGKHDPRIPNKHPGLYDILAGALFVGGVLIISTLPD